MLSYATLRQRQQALKSDFRDEVALRVHRSISWVGRAEQETDDLDAAFIFYWIAFNAAYASEDYGVHISTERQTFKAFFEKVIAAENGKAIYNVVWDKYSSAIRTLLNNRYVFEPFWKCHNGYKDYENWEERFESAKKVIGMHLSAQNTLEILCIIFDRLYILRNQMMHGGATWNSAVNRDQLRDGVNILRDLTTIFISIMMNRPSFDWGEPYYPLAD